MEEVAPPAHPMLKTLILKLHDRLNRRKFERLFHSRKDPYRYGTLEFERRRYDLMLRFIGDRHYLNALEVGCAEGHFTEKLFTFCQNITTMDVSETAIERARKKFENNSHIQIIQANIRDWFPKPISSFNLIVLSEVLYYLGERNDIIRFTGIAQETCLRPVSSKLVNLLSKNGRILLAHSHASGERRSREFYREILQGLGLRLIQEEPVPPTGEKGTDQCLVSLLEK
ncbi:MAG: methyltransferase domain-containing protein [Elusimicrobia bacterium]|nr:methyltransferase domain-containing protein [Elusimicrobiota bacterium]